MVTLHPTELAERDMYKVLIGSIIPRPVAVISTKSTSDIINIAPFSYFSIVSTTPPIISVSIQRKNGEAKDTARNILETKEAVVHILDEDNVSLANETAAPLAPEISELTRANFDLISSEKLVTPGLQQAKVRFETTLYQHVPIKKNQDVTADLLLLEIQVVHIEDDIYEDGKIDPQKLAAMSRLAGNDYATIGDIKTIARPLE